MTLEWLEANRNWLIPLGSAVVITSAFIALVRWYFGLSARVKRLDNENEDELASFRINHFSTLPDGVKKHLPSAAAEITCKNLVALYAEPEAVGALREQRPGTYQLVRDLTSRAKERRTLWFLRWVPVGLLLVLGLLVWMLWQA